MVVNIIKIYKPMSFKKNTLELIKICDMSIILSTCRLFLKQSQFLSLLSLYLFWDCGFFLLQWCTMVTVTHAGTTVSWS